MYSYIYYIYIIFYPLVNIYTTENGQNSSPCIENPMGGTHQSVSSAGDPAPSLFFFCREPRRYGEEFQGNDPRNLTWPSQ